MKKILAVLLALCLPVLLTGCRIDWDKTKNNVRTFVLENFETLSADIEQWNFENSVAFEGIEKIFPERGLLEKADFVDYDCGGAGFGSSTAYFGFYYAENDDMTRIWCASEPLAAHGEGYLYQQEGGDNRYYTEHIIGHFYYYEAMY